MLEEAIANIKEAIELYLETLPIDERNVRCCVSALKDELRVTAPLQSTSALYT
jgi:hypothetical protein